MTVLRMRLHFKNVFEEGELQPEATIAFFATVQMDGKWGKRRSMNNVGFENTQINLALRPLIRTSETSSRR